ncbi:uncharacterized protein CEXT_235901 [Caerostris extrusa]|uniref:Uncharacterized protein n=1 Tax=Caerostris extrusa TaxID=172846 RepID=A0AAV4XTJ6_CAEEX|nr:uncharacterized protein CEXT_235901 [Caerostris extrusa]
MSSGYRNSVSFNVKTIPYCKEGRKTDRYPPIGEERGRKKKKKLLLTVRFLLPPPSLSVIDQFLFHCAYLLEAASRNLFWRKPTSSISPNPFSHPQTKAKEIACNYRMMSWTIYRLFQIFAVDARWRKPPARISKGCCWLMDFRADR